MGWAGRRPGPAPRAPARGPPPQIPTGIPPRPSRAGLVPACRAADPPAAARARRSRAGERQDDREGRARAGPALHKHHITALAARQPAADVEAEPRARRVPAGGVFDPDELVEDALVGLGGNAASLVADLDARLPAAA